MDSSNFRFLNISPRQADEMGLRTLYYDSFPPEERRPWSHFANMPSEFSMLAIIKGDAAVGLLTLWRFDSFAYIEHFGDTCKILCEKFQG